MTSVNLIPDGSDPLHDLLNRAAFAPISNVGWIRVTGEDRVRWLNGMVTNNIATLQSGEGCYNFFLNAQGRIMGDCTAWMAYHDVCIDLQTAADRLPALIAMLDHFIIMDDVELRQIEPSTGLALIGPQAAALLDTLGWEAPDPFCGVQVQTSFYDSRVELMHVHSPIVPRFELWADSKTIAKLSELLTDAGASLATAQALEQLRILSGTPLYGTDIRNSDTAKDLPQETAQTRALHFSKGCYLGQEIVERIRSRGAVHRTFTGFVLTGDLPPAGTALYDPARPERPAGELTSVTSIDSKLIAQNSKLYSSSNSPRLGVALGYLRREALDSKATLTYLGGTATPTTLPFQLP